MAPRSTRRHAAVPAPKSLPSESRDEVARLIDDVSNRLQVILGFAQILHELDQRERDDAVEAIGRECEHLRETLRTLTGLSRAADGQAPWQPTSVPTRIERPAADSP